MDATNTEIVTKAIVLPQNLTQHPQTADSPNRLIRVPGIEYQDEYIKYAA
jgi:hypothetical protein